MCSFINYCTQTYLMDGIPTSFEAQATPLEKNSKPTRSAPQHLLHFSNHIYAVIKLIAMELGLHPPSLVSASGQPIKSNEFLLYFDTNYSNEHSLHPIKFAQLLQLITAPAITKTVSQITSQLEVASDTLFSPMN